MREQLSPPEFFAIACPAVHEEHLPVRDEFLSEEDLDLANLSDAELYAYWDLWLHQAQATNHLDAHLYSHGVFIEEPLPDPTPLDDRAKRALAFLLAGDCEVLHALRRQLAGVGMSRWSCSVGGFWALFAPATSTRALLGQPSFKIDDVHCEVAGLALGMRIILQVKEGVATDLEGYTLNESLPNEWQLGELKYIEKLRSKDPLIERPAAAPRHQN